MRLSFLSISFGLAVLAGSSATVMAGGFDDDAGGMKESIYDGVPVPAPHPIPEYEADWYIRGDVGYAFSNDSRITSSGSGFSAYGDNTDGPLALSFGMGRYLTSNIRVEFAVDIRGDYKAGPNEQDYSTVVAESATAVLAGGAGGTNRHYYDVSRTDEIRLGRYSGLFNLYYDFKNNSRFTPYLGGGAGLVIHTIKRHHNETATCQYSTNDATGVEVNYTDPFDPTSNVCASVGQLLPGGTTELNSTDGNTYVSESSSVETGYGLAGNLMAGVAFDMGNGLLLDVNYRYMWMGGDVKVIAPSMGQISTVNIGDTHEHTLRAGIRMNIN